MSDLVSVIMGVYNAEKTLRPAIESIINQTYPNWELIICDDGSTDRSHWLAQEYKDPRIIVIRNKQNMGLGYALNRCLEKVQGEYIARMDADDISLPERLERQLEFMKAHPEYAVVSTAIIMFDNAGDFYPRTVVEQPDARAFIIGSPVAHPACMMRKECLDAVGRYSEGRDTFRVEDTDLWIKLLEKGYKFYNLTDYLYRLRFDMNAVRRQRMAYRWNGTVVRIKGCKKLNMPLPCYLMALRPVVIGLIPMRIRYQFHMLKKKR